MEKQTVFIKRYPSKGELPKMDGWYFTDRGLYFIYISNLKYIMDCKYWLEEIVLPSEEEIYSESFKSDKTPKDFIKGANFILNHLKSNTNETDKI